MRLRGIGQQKGRDRKCRAGRTRGKTRRTWWTKWNMSEHDVMECYRRVHGGQQDDFHSSVSLFSVWVRHLFPFVLIEASFEPTKIKPRSPGVPVILYYYSRENIRLGGWVLRRLKWLKNRPFWIWRRLRSSGSGLVFGGECCLDFNRQGNMQSLWLCPH